MGINLSKNVIANLRKGRAPSKSWSDFLINMTIDMAENKLILLGGLSIKAATSKTGSEVASEFVSKAANIANLAFFSKSLIEEYDNVIRNGGKTILGGVKVKSGNKIAATTLLTTILTATNASTTGDLLRDIGPAIQLYWAGAKLEDGPTVPSIPCFGTLKNITTNVAINLSPGVWVPISVLPNSSYSPFLLSFITSAMVHMLTVGGFFQCTCQYPPPAPPAPGFLPWVGYLVPPITNPTATLKGISNVEIAMAAAGKVADIGITLAETNSVNDALTSVINTTADAKVKAAAEAIKNDNAKAMADAGMALNPTLSKYTSTKTITLG
jgi:hypothetical protein